MDDTNLRRKPSLKPATVLSNVGLPKLLLTDLTFIFALHAGKQLFLSQPISATALLSRVLAYGTGLAFLWSFAAGKLQDAATLKPSIWGLSSIMFYSRNAAILFALSKLPSPRVIFITQHSALLCQSLTSSISLKHRLGLLLAFISILAIDAGMYGQDVWTALPAYVALALEAISSVVIDHASDSLLPTIGSAPLVMLSALGAWSLSFVVNALPLPVVSAVPAESLPASPVLLLAIACVLLTPLGSQQLLKLSKLHRGLQFPYFLTFSVATVAISAMFGEGFLFTDVLFSLWVAWVVCLRTYDRDSSSYTSVVATARRYVEVIMANPESRKIFYFLLLNMCYMLVQMLYGLWTNSLGLISDAIHMAFDCMAIGIGLVASVMAQWTPNERFTYGYTRIETLSGFSNGIFLILISVFIVFEAVQRLMSPPEMNTSQLLLVSSIGLAVNLFGMFAMGGHHHHGGHSHSHGHDHDHLVPTAHSHHHSQLSEDVVTSISQCTDSVIHVDGNDLHHEGHVQTARSPRETIPDHALSKPKTLIDHLHLVDQHAGSPVTPSYQFDHDEHLELHHSHQLSGQPCKSDSPHEGHSHNMRGVFLHVMADTLGSVGVIISTLLIQFYGWTGFDPIASLFIAVLIAASVIPLVIDTGKVLLLDLSNHSQQVQYALNEVSHISGISSFASQFWLKDDVTVMGSIQVEMSHISPIVESDLDKSYNETQLAVEKIQNVFMDQISGLQQLSIQIDTSC